LITGAEGGTHGYINTDPNMQAIFMAWGAGIPKGVRLAKISNLDVAPTIAALLGVEMKHITGHVISEIVDVSGAKKTGHR
jgi:predicted AlkP superfamily pyrophosphatase or phosphodiesterase